MSKNNKGFITVALIVVAVIAALGAGTYVVVKKGGAKSDNKEQQAVQPTDEQRADAGAQLANVSLKGNGSIEDLRKLSKDLTCTYATSVNGIQADFTVYLSKSGKIRVQGKSKTGNIPDLQVIMVKKGDSFEQHTWSGDRGFKTVIPEATMTASSNVAQNAYTQKVDYACAEGPIDEALFTPPTNINFGDISSMMPPTQAR